MPLLDGPSRITVTNRVQNHSYMLLTLKVLKDYGITVSPEFKSFEIPGNQTYQEVPCVWLKVTGPEQHFPVSWEYCLIVSPLRAQHGFYQGDRAILDILKRIWEQNQ